MESTTERKPPKVNISLYVAQSGLDRVEALAKTKRATRSDVIRAALAVADNHPDEWSKMIDLIA